MLFTCCNIVYIVGESFLLGPNDVTCVLIGSDLLRLCREDLIQICGTADGIRLYNALQAK